MSISALMDTLERHASRASISCPSTPAQAALVGRLPALSECLVHAGPAGPEYLAIISKKAVFRIASFDERAAMEAAARTYEARRRGQRKGGNPEAAKAKIKFDRQIVAIAKVEGATAVYSDDADVIDYAREAGLEGYRLADLPEPPEDPQHALHLEAADEL